MKKLFYVILMLAPLSAFCQFGVSYHQSGIQFIGFNYEFKDRIRPEVRIGTDNYFEDISLELVGMYDFIDKGLYEFYGGAGLRANSFDGLVLPFGLNVYPFDEKQFGFHMELAPIIGGDDQVLRGSFGIRFRFL